MNKPAVSTPHEIVIRGYLADLDESPVGLVLNEQPEDVELGVGEDVADDSVVSRDVLTVTREEGERQASALPADQLVQVDIDSAFDQASVGFAGAGATVEVGKEIAGVDDLGSDRAGLCLGGGRGKKDGGEDG